MSNRDALLARIKAISARTVDNGCTEAEAMAAAAMLAKLLSEHGMSMSDVQIGEELCKTEYLDTGRKAMHEVQYCANAVSAFTDCEAWISSTPSGTKAFAFFGLPGDVETACYLMSMLRGTMDREALAYLSRAKEVGAVGGRRAAHAFLLGMASRVSKRLCDLKAAERATTTTTTGRDLVVVKGAVVAKQFAELNLRLRSNSRRSSARDAGAYHAGRAAGDRVSFNRAVGQSGGTMLLGR